MSKPNVLILGAQKAGTTYLGQKLSQHPQVKFVEGEIHFFNKPENLAKGIDWYESHFNSIKHHVVFGEKTPNYLWTNIPPNGTDLPGCAERICNYAPDAKLIIVLRNPADRAISAFNHHYRQGRISPFWNIDECFTGKYQSEIDKYGVLSMGLYHRQIIEYLKHYSLGQMLILIYEEDILKQPEEGLLKCLEFLDVDTSFKFSNLKEQINAEKNAELVNLINYYFPVFKRYAFVLNKFLKPAGSIRPTASGYQQLSNYYQNENQKLFELLCRPNIWNKN